MSCHSCPLILGVVLLSNVVRVSAQPVPLPPPPPAPLVATAAEIPALEHDAVAPSPGMRLPGCVSCVTPVWPRPSTEAWRFRLHVVIDAAGRAATVRIVQTLVGDAAARPMGPDGDVSPPHASSPSARAGLAVLAAVRQWRFEPPPVAPLLLVTDVGVDTRADPDAVTSSRPSVAPRRVGGDLAPPRKIVDVPPAYPIEAQKARVTGQVVIDAVIGVDGAVTDARVLRGVPMLDEPALAAVRQWRYTPTVVDGVAVPVIVTVTVTFSLGR